MSIEQKRVAVAKVYPFPRWAAKVKLMSDAQVHATYMRLMNAGKI